MGELKYVVVRVYSNQLAYLPSSHYEERNQEWEKWIDEVNINVPSSLGETFVASHQWAWDHTQAEFVFFNKTCLTKHEHPLSGDVLNKNIVQKIKLLY